jgi:hypothetical protein
MSSADLNDVAALIELVDNAAAEIVALAQSA